VLQVQEEIDCVPQLGLESNSSDLGLRFRHEFSNGLEDDSKLAVVLLFQFIESPGKYLVRADHLSKLNKSSHDGNIYLNSSFAVEHAREHCDSLFGEGVGAILSSSSTF